MKDSSISQDITRDDYHWVVQRCPICEKPPTKFLGRRGGEAHRAALGVECDIWQCEKCGLIFPNPMPIPVGGLEQHYGVPADDYFKVHDVNLKGGFAANMLKGAAELTGGTGRLLDIGTGRGELLKAAREGGWQAVGAEPSAGFAEYSRNYSGAEVINKPVEKCGFDDASFDVVILAAVLEHLYNPDEVIGEIARILRQGGALYIDVPNETGLYFRLGNTYRKLRRRDWVVNLAPTFSPYHVFGFNERSLKYLLKKHKLQSKDCHFYAGADVLLVRKGWAGTLEKIGSRAAITLSNFGGLGSYIETWAVKN